VQLLVELISLMMSRETEEAIIRRRGLKSKVSVPTCSESTLLRRCRILMSASVSDTERAFVLHTTPSAFTITRVPACVLLSQIFVIRAAVLYSKAIL